MLDRFFGTEARARIEAAVHQAEAASTGQIVPVVVERSGRYAAARLRAALLAAGLVTAGLLAAARWYPLALPELVLAQLAGGVFGALAVHWAPLERLLAGRLGMEIAIRQRALRAFHEHDLHHTKNGTGVLVFASLFERRALVMGDHGIDACMGPEEWRRAVAALVSGMGRGDPASGFCDAVGAVGAKLAEHFPRTGDGPGNELPDGLQVEP